MPWVRRPCPGGPPGGCWCLAVVFAPATALERLGGGGGGTLSEPFLLAIGPYGLVLAAVLVQAPLFASCIRMSALLSVL